MTKFKKRTLCFLTAIIMIVGLVGVMPLVSAGAETSGDFEYEVLEDGTAEITGYTGDATEVNIPSEIAGKKVTSIGSYAFAWDEHLTSIMIPDSVINIGDDTFVECYQLTSVMMSKNVTIIGNRSFAGCIGLQSITIPYGVTSIGDAAFSRTSIDKLFIPNSVTIIGSGAFWNTPWLKNKQQENPIVIVNNILIDGQTCTGNVIIPRGVINIGSGAFKDCSSITSITISDSVTSIGGSTFANCSSLKSITIPNSVMEIGKNAFGYHIYYGENYKIDNLIIYCYSNTVGEQYAIDNGFDYILLDGEQTLGDLSGDGQITTADVGIINSFARGVISPTPEQLYLADANGDGEITTVDVGLINKIAKGV